MNSETKSITNEVKAVCRRTRLLQCAFRKQFFKTGYGQPAVQNRFTAIPAQAGIQLPPRPSENSLLVGLAQTG
jgi:hypothetical protein